MTKFKEEHVKEIYSSVMLCVNDEKTYLRIQQ